MSLSSATNRNDYTGNGSVDTYSYTFKVFSEDHLVVTVRDTSDVETTLTKTTHYTVSGVGSTNGGSVALVAGAFDWLNVGNDLKSGYRLTIRRVVPLTQETDIRNAGTFYPATHEDQFDKQVMISQQQQDDLDRSVTLPETVTSSDFDPTLPSDILDSANKVPMINATGDGFTDAANWPTANEISAAQGYAQAAYASADAAAISAAAASGHEDLAQDWAMKTNGIVDSTDYAAKAWAIGGTGVTDTATRGSAKEWATKTSGTVDGTEYSAKKYAQDAAAALASAFFRDVVYITSASSPYTVSQSDNGKLFDIDSSGGAIAINLPEISGLSLPFNLAMKLTVAGNTVTISRGGTDTIDGGTSKTLVASGTGLQISADTDGSPDNWTSLDFGTIADGSVTLAKLAAAVAEALVPKGAMLPYGGGTVPSGWLFCNGRAVSRTTYADLYAAIGDRYGSGDGSTTFNLPETRYEFLRGYGGIANATGSGSASSNNATFTAHGYTKSGTKVRLSSGTLSGLTTSTDYFVIYVDADTLAFATTRANALAGTKIAITGANSAVIRQWEDPDASSRVASASGGATGDNIGSVQEQATARPTTSFTTGTESADHFHYQFDNIGGTGGGNMASAAANYTSGRSATTSGVSQNHTHTVTGGGDNETRPQNFSAMMIIKY